MKTVEKLASGWLLLLGFAFLMLPASQVLNKGSTQETMSHCGTPQYDAYVGMQLKCSTQKETMSHWGTPDMNDIQGDQDSALSGLILGIPSALLGGWLALGLYRQGQQEKVIAQPIGDHFQSTFFKLIQAGNGYITVFHFAMEA